MSTSSIPMVNLRLSMTKLNKLSPLTPRRNKNRESGRRLTKASPPTHEVDLSDDVPEEEHIPWCEMRCRRSYQLACCAGLLLLAIISIIVIVVYYRTHNWQYRDDSPDLVDRNSRHPSGRVPPRTQSSRATSPDANDHPELRKFGSVGMSSTTGGTNGSETSISRNINATKSVTAGTSSSMPLFLTEESKKNVSENVTNEEQTTSASPVNGQRVFGHENRTSTPGNVSFWVESSQGSTTMDSVSALTDDETYRDENISNSSNHEIHTSIAEDPNPTTGGSNFTAMSENSIHFRHNVPIYDAASAAANENQNLTTAHYPEQNLTFDYFSSTELGHAGNSRAFYHNLYLRDTYSNTPNNSDLSENLNLNTSADGGLHETSTSRNVENFTSTTFNSTRVINFSDLANFELNISSPIGRNLRVLPTSEPDLTDTCNNESSEAFNETLSTNFNYSGNLSSHDANATAENFVNSQTSDHNLTDVRNVDQNSTDRNSSENSESFGHNSTDTYYFQNSSFTEDNATAIDIGVTSGSFVNLTARSSGEILNTSDKYAGISTESTTSSYVNFTSDHDVANVNVNISDRNSTDFNDNTPALHKNSTKSGFVDDNTTDFANITITTAKSSSTFRNAKDNITTIDGKSNEFNESVKIA